MDMLQIITEIHRLNINTQIEVILVIFLLCFVLRYYEPQSDLHLRLFYTEDNGIIL